MRRPRVGLGAVIVLALGALLAPLGVSAAHATSSDAPPQLTPAQPGTLEQCAELAGFAFAGTSITRAELLAAGPVQGVTVGEHCLVQGRMNERVSDVYGQTYAIGFEMRMPVDWNGRYLYQANGGLDGNVSAALGRVGGGESGLQAGFAVISSDAGHSGAQNPTFGLDPQARRDYGYQAVGTLTPMAKALIEAGYGRGPDRSYMTGGSNGGRHTMVGASRYADQYDGFLAVAPGFNLPKAAVAQIWGAQRWASIATDTADLSSAFTGAERTLVASAILARCDNLDGLVDGLVQAEQRCETAFSIDRDVPTCDAERDGTCLTAAQKEVVSAVFAGAVTSTGEAIYNSFPYDPGLVQPGWANWKFSASVTRDTSAVGYIFGTPPDAPPLGNLVEYGLTLDIDDAAASIYRTDGIYTESSMEFMTPPDPAGLDELRARGGKMIVIHGASDGVFSTDDTAAWYDELDAHHGGDAEAFTRYFTVPGMGHVSGGPATDRYAALAALVDWVEGGEAPARILASVNPANPDIPAEWSDTRSRPLCPYPSVAVYVGGDPEDAASFECSTSDAPIAISAPTIGGQPDVGQRLTADPGDWSGEDIAYSYQWLRDGSPIRNATRAEHRVTLADQGTSLSVRVTASNADGEQAATSAEVVVRHATVTVVTTRPLIVATAGRPVTVTVKVLPARIEASGAVTVTVDGRTFEGPVVDGRASIEVGALPRGSHRIVAAYSGSDTAAPSTGYGLAVVLR